MASEKQLSKWYNEASKISDKPEYIQAYAEYRQKAKKADQQLVRLEALSHEKHFEGVLEFAYKGAIRDIGSWGGSKRFNTAPPTKLTELEAKISDIDKFLSKATATKRNIVKFYKKRADTINKRYGKEFGVKFTWQELANYYENEKQRKNDVKLASKTEVRAIAVIKKLTSEKTVNDITDANEKIQQITGSDKILAKEVKRLLDQGLDYNKLLGGN